MKRLTRTLAMGGMVLGLAAVTQAQQVQAKIGYDETLIPRFNIPKMSAPPKIDGTIDPAEWKEAAKVMGMVSTGGLQYKDRPVSFWLAWDEQHLYLAYRVDTLTTPVPHLKRASRDKYATSVVHDDALEGGLFLHDRNKKEGEVSSYLKFTLNSLGAGEYMKNYPSIGQVMFNWTPDFKIANRTHTDAAGVSWWEMEIAMDLKDVQMTVPHKAGDLVDIGLFADVKNPNWQWLDFPSASGHLEHYGFPRAVLTDDQPYVQVEEISGLHDEKLALKTAVCNPSAKPVKVNASLLLQHGPALVARAGQLKDPTPILDDRRDLEIPAKGSVRFDVAKEFPGLPSADKGKGFLQFAVTCANREQSRTVYSFACNFWGKDKKYLAPSEYKPVLGTKLAYNPANGRLALSVDELDAPIPADAKPAGATYKVTFGDRTLAEGKLRYFVNRWYDDLLEVGALLPGKYDVAFALVDAGGQELATAKGSFEKKDEAKEFAKWWGNKIGNTEKVLKPFEALKVQKGGESKTAIACTRRVYEFGSLGLPVQIYANGGPVLTTPARIVVKVGGKEYAVPTDQAVKVTAQKDWRVDFTCKPVNVAGVTFSATGWMEQDGLVELALTYAPEKHDVPVEIDGLRIEWPVDDVLGLSMACMGQGGNYSARTICAVPKGSGGVGQVWNTRDDIGATGSGRRVGNFVGNLWVGTEQRGLFWCADSDFGWEPDARVPALALVRVQGSGERVQDAGSKRFASSPEPRTLNPGASSVVMVNNIIGSADGKAVFKLDAPRTVRFGYNASPFRNLAPGFRVNQFASAGSFSGGKYKHNWDSGQDFFTVLSPPFGDPARWPEYYAFCRQEAKKLTYDGASYNNGTQSVTDQPGNSAYYRANNRAQFFTANQIALRGYGWKSIENPNPYNTFAGDWLDTKSEETLSTTYRDYMIWLMDRQVKEGGCQHFYFDISFGQCLHRELANGFGYRLPDGGVQPESSDTNLREWYKRVFAMMQENHLYPGGVSGHATHSFSLKMLAFTDCILDSEYPMSDSIDVYPSDAMIALSCPHTFGVNVQHLGNFMNPTWAMMHDAAGGDSRGLLMSMPEFKQWGMTRTDVQFIPYWRNQAVVKEITPGLIASTWRRPGSALIAIMNYRPDNSEPTLPGKLTLDLQSLGVPAEALAKVGEAVRIRQIYNSDVQMGYLKTHQWVQDNKGKALPPIEPKLDPATGTISGFDINYHDVKFIAVDWEVEPVNDAVWNALAADEAMRTRLLNWGINGAIPLPAGKLIASDNPAIKVELWKRTGDPVGRGNSILLRVTNAAALADTKDKTPTTGTIKLDLKGLDVDVRQLWAEFASAVALDGQPVENRESAGQKRSAGISYNAYTGELYCNLKKGESRVFSIDRY